MGDYNGWTNWETWHTALLIDNDQGLYQKKVDLIRSNASLSKFKSALSSAETDTRRHFRKTWGAKDDTGKGFGKVNWAEIHRTSKEELG